MRTEARLRFRPLLWPTAIFLPALALLVGLGVWQLDRREEKLALIARVETALAAEPVSLDVALAGELASADYMRVRATGIFVHERESYLFTRGPDGRPGYRVLTPFRLDDDRLVLVDRGFVPETLREPGTRAEGQVAGRRMVSGVLRVLGPRGIFAAEPDRAQRVWYARDPADIARTLGIQVAAPVIIEADAVPNPGGWPLAGWTRGEFRNPHLGYAVTWFGLALALIVIYLAYHRSQGRLGAAERP